MSTIADDPRIDPRLKALFGTRVMPSERNVTSRAELLAEANSAAGIALRELATTAMDAMDDESIAPTERLDFATHEIVSEPDRNTIRLRVIQPQTSERLPCVYFIHGGGMARSSCFDGVFRMWGRILAHQGVVVVMVEFRNAVVPSTVPEVAPFPGGLNDCVSGVKWVHEHADQLGVDRDRIVVAGESGGGNLTLALGMQLKREGELHLIRGLTPCVLTSLASGPRNGSHPRSRTTASCWTCTTTAVEWATASPFEAEDPLAWPSFATESDVAGLVPTVISVNECDPLRDEGIEFYRLLIRAGVRTRCHMNIGAVHGAELLAIACPDISFETARSIAAFCRDS